METVDFNHAGYESYLCEHRLMASRCQQCGEVFLPPREMCPNCYATQMEWVELSGEGKLAGFTSIHVGLPDMAAIGYNRENPYCVGVVELAEGPSISAQILDGNCAHPKDLHIGMPVRAIFVERGTDPDLRHIVLAFEPVR